MRRRNVFPAADPERVISTRVYRCESQRPSSVCSECAARAQSMLRRSSHGGNVEPIARGAIRMEANGIGELTSQGTLDTRKNVGSLRAYMMSYVCIRTCFDLTMSDSMLLAIERNGSSLFVLTTLRAVIGQ